MLPRLLLTLVTASFLVGCGENDREQSFDLSSIMNDEPDTQFRRVDAPRTLVFPKDHGSHKEYRQEWWYLTSVLKTETGREFGTQFTLFRLALDSEIDMQDWRSNQMYRAHVAVSDVDNQRHVDFERTVRGHKELVAVSHKPFELAIDGWRLYATSTEFSPLRLHVKNREIELMLSLRMSKPVALHGDEGFSRKGNSYASYYYSIPRLVTEGYISMDGTTYKVSGSSWFDHEWFTGSLGPDFSGWDWMSLQLNDGSDFVFASLRSRSDNEHTFPIGLKINSNGEAETLTKTEWSFEPMGYWQQYPVEWRVDIGSRQLLIVAAFDDQMMDTSIRYWEGLVHVFEDDAQVGSGYLELTGY